MHTHREFVKEKPTWCPGCGDFGVLKAIQDAAARIGLSPKDIVMVSGIGCSGKITSYFRSYGFHSMHGRTLPVATGIRLANPALKVLAVGGDGDGYGIGLNHFIHAIRRNVDLTYIVMDNHVYGNTKGQTAPTSDIGYVSGSTPMGSIEEPVRPLSLALAAGVTYIAQGMAGNIKQLERLIRKGMEHEGFAFINVFSPCVTYDKKHTYTWYKEHLIDLDEDKDYDPSNLATAFAKVTEHAERVSGLIYQRIKPSFERQLPKNKIAKKNEQPALKDVMFEAFS